MTTQQISNTEKHYFLQNRDIVESFISVCPKLQVTKLKHANVD